MVVDCQIHQTFPLPKFHAIATVTSYWSSLSWFLYHEQSLNCVKIVKDHFQKCLQLTIKCSISVNSMAIIENRIHIAIVTNYQPAKYSVKSQYFSMFLLLKLLLIVSKFSYKKLHLVIRLLYSFFGKTYHIILTIFYPVYLLFQLNATHPMVAT